VQPGDALSHIAAGVAGVGGAPVQGHGRDVDGSDLPAVLGQPDNVGAFPAADVERGTGDEAGCLGDELRVGVTAPEGVTGLIALVPER
jgi:hypothetical protein